MTRIKLPASLRPVSEAPLDDLRQLTIIGGNGAGKSLFMDEMIHLCGAKAFCLNALSAFYPEREESTLPGSIDMQYREAVRQQSYMRTDAVSELDKILYMLFADELENLICLKEEYRKAKSRKAPKPGQSRLDVVSRHWERLFPGNKITISGGRVMFRTTAGSDLITAFSLSQGEKAALYFLAAIQFAAPGAVIFIDFPTLFIHPAIQTDFWNTIEGIRPDCIFVYNSVDENFVTTRTRNVCLWIKRYDSGRRVWDYDLVDAGSLTEEMMAEFAGNQRPVLFIEGDTRHSIDVRLYSLVFPEWTVRPVGSCNKVIETTRAFNDQRAMHHLSSRGIVDRDRRSDKEVEYLRNKRIMVPDVAEIENLFLLPGVMEVMAESRGRDAQKIIRRVRRDVLRTFKRESESQALQHIRHKVKRDVECKIDARFSCITALETHLRGLAGKLEPRRHYNQLRQEFAEMVRDEDYTGVLRVFNHKPMLSDSGIHKLLGYRTKDDYIAGVLDTLKSSGSHASRLRDEIRRCLHADAGEN